MGFIQNLFSGGAKTALTFEVPQIGIPLDILDSISSVAGKIFSNKDDERKFQLLFEQIKQRPEELKLAMLEKQNEGQMQTNQIEAANPSVFVSGGRSYIIWVCGTCLALFFIPQFIIGDYFWIKECISKGACLPYPIDGKELIDLVIAILGLSAAKTVERMCGVK